MCVFFSQSIAILQFLIRFYTHHLIQLRSIDFCANYLSVASLRPFAFCFIAPLGLIIIVIAIISFNMLLRPLLLRIHRTAHGRFLAQNKSRTHNCIKHIHMHTLKLYWSHNLLIRIRCKGNGRAKRQINIIVCCGDGMEWNWYVLSYIYRYRYLYICCALSKYGCK